jgi:hypothetical protein
MLLPLGPPFDNTLTVPRLRRWSVAHFVVVKKCAEVPERDDGSRQNSK